MAYQSKIADLDIHSHIQNAFKIYVHILPHQNVFQLKQILTREVVELEIIWQKL